MSAIKKAAETFDTHKAFAEALGVPPSFVSQWISGYRRVPPVHCMTIESLTGGKVTAVQLRPDIFKKRTAA